MSKRRILLIILFSLLSNLILLNFFITMNMIYAKGESYARIKTSNSYLYKSSQLNESIDNKICLLPETYFVKILNNYNSTFYQAEFNNLTGFVKKIDVTLINEIPQKPYPTNIYFNTKSNTSCFLRSSPKVKVVVDNVLKTIPSGTTNLKFYGKTLGEEAVDMQGTIWYLTEYEGELGYVHSFYVSTYLSLPTNTEQVTFRNTLEDFVPNPLTNTQSAIIIIIISMPVIVILVLLYKPRHETVKIKNKITTHKEKIDTSADTNYFNDPEL